MHIETTPILTSSEIWLHLSGGSKLCSTADEDEVVSAQSKVRKGFFLFFVNQFVLYLNRGVQRCVGLPSLLQEKITCRYSFCDFGFGAKTNLQVIFSCKRRRNLQKRNTPRELHS